MSDLDAIAEHPGHLPPWLDWLLSNTQMGLLVLNPDTRVVFVNKWLLVRAGLSFEQVNGRHLHEVFPVLEGSHFQRTLKQSMRTGFPAVLSQTLHPSPFPLYVQTIQRVRGALMRQSIHIVPMGPKDAVAAGQRMTLVQISDVSPNMMREGLLKAQAEKMSDIALVDVLTGIGNRRAFEQSLDAEVRAALRAHTPVGLLMLDVDHFKLFNDHYGHPAGDRCLRTVAEVVRRVCRRPRDVITRYGGEELAVILPETDLAGAVRVASDVVSALRETHLAHERSPSAAFVTLSVGVSALVADATNAAADLLHRADAALYAAKNTGRNRVVYCDPLGNMVSTA
ncbi:MAG: diguanylate cyclase [Burkholderiales bacterium]|jgi:diguanylate cyclase (GGDEF)-like protein|nr:diguanylate cyclase [Burkholderiales bacterium]